MKNYDDQDKKCLIDLDRAIPYHSIKDIDQMANIIFQEIYKNINQQPFY